MIDFVIRLEKLHNFAELNTITVQVHEAFAEPYDQSKRHKPQSQEWHEERSEALADWSDVDGALWLRELQVERKHAEPLQYPLKFERPVEIERK